MCKNSYGIASLGSNPGSLAQQSYALPATPLAFKDLDYGSLDAMNASKYL